MVPQKARVSDDGVADGDLLSNVVVLAEVLSVGEYKSMEIGVDSRYYWDWDVD